MEKLVLGIDVGSVSVSAVVLDTKKNIINKNYKFHYGKVKETIIEILTSFKLKKIHGIAITSSTPAIIKHSKKFDNQVSLIDGAKFLNDKIGSILNVGGENFGLITFSENGDYKSYKSNSACAAGTGSFLDQQAKRLALKNSEELSFIAYKNTTNIPKIATRCAVFAKTDLIHAQQEGYSLEQICDGLCEGLAKNIIDSLFSDNEIIQPVLLTGGVSQNKAVIKHLEKLLGINIVTNEFSYLYSAIGVCLNFLESEKLHEIKINNLNDLFIDEKHKKEYIYDNLQLNKSIYPDFDSLEKYLYKPTKVENGVTIEVDIYEHLEKANNVFMGIDIGSTSTKATITNLEGVVLAGFYTKTAGQPIKAIRSIFESIDDIIHNKKVKFSFKGIGTTGSGRKFIGKIIGCDIILDEITAHARAAYDLNKDVDTIIEIGGQDAKFTTMKDGMVTLSIMNNVCAAGTGSFIEEQALKLGVSLTEYSKRAENVKSPISSDRCTVFMERDINYYLSNGYTVDEILATILHSVRENYISKVAIEANIGKNVCFQGATARNKALVAAFEQKLQRPIFVSKFCHLTGALGCCLILKETHSKKTEFRGINIYKEEIPVESEVCNLCNNNCKINKVTVGNEILAFGFLCGRDYDTKKFISNDKSNFDLLKQYKKVFNLKKPEIQSEITIGIPSSLHIAVDFALWKSFFNSLGVKVVLSDEFKSEVKTSIKDGKKISGAEFCAPMQSFFGHVKVLTDKCDYIFIPVYTEDKDNKEKDYFRQHCYYTQFAPSIASQIETLNLKDKLLSPVIENKPLSNKITLFNLLKDILKLNYFGYWKVASAYDDALSLLENGRDELKELFKYEIQNNEDISVMLIGRPYVILSNSLNKGIPGIFSHLGIKSFYQDMLSYKKEDLKEYDALLKAFHWSHTAKLLEASIITAITKKLYPVFITSFKCGPDSFAIEYFKKIMDKFKKPYLILQIDEHDSSVGYETRIEAAVRSFKNHYESTKIQEKPIDESVVINPNVIKKYTEGKTLLIPSWDDLSTKLIEAVLKMSNVDVRIAGLDKKSIQQGLRLNTNQCIPVNIIFQSFVDYINDNNLDKSNLIVWIFDSVIPCNIRLYPYYFKTMFETMGNGFEKIQVFTGEVSFSDISMQTSLEIYFAYMFGGVLRKMGCKVRPYEINKGETNKVLAESLQLFYDSFMGKIPRNDAVRVVVDKFKQIKVDKSVKRPKVAIFGDLYARDNDVMNQNLIEAIEEAGGEAVTTPYNEFAKMILDPYFKKWMRQGFYSFALKSKFAMSFTASVEKEFYVVFNEILEEPLEKEQVDIEEVLKNFNITLKHSGESFDNIVKIFSIIKHDKDISLFVQTAPAFCCAGIVTESMMKKIEKMINIPIVSISYDGTGKLQNDKIIPYIKYSQKK